MLDEVVVTGSRPTNSGYMQPGGLWWEGSFGQGNPYRARHTEFMGSIDRFLNLIGFDWLGRFSFSSKLSDAKTEFGISETKPKPKSDAEIKKESTGENTTETDAFGRPVPQKTTVNEAKEESWQVTDTLVNINEENTRISIATGDGRVQGSYDPGDTIYTKKVLRNRHSNQYKSEYLKIYPSK